MMANHTEGKNTFLKRCGNFLAADFKTFRTRRRFLLLLIDIAIMVVIYAALRLLPHIFAGDADFYIAFSVPTFILFGACIILSRVFSGVYTSIWRYASVGACLKLILFDLIGCAVFCLFDLINKRVNAGFIYTVVMLLLTIFLTLLSRFIYQYLYEKKNLVADRRSLYRKENKLHRINIAIVGAGNVGASLANELLRNQSAHYYPYCFIDKDSAKVGGEINGIRIYPEDEHIVDRIHNMPIQEIVVAIPEASQEDKQRLFDLYKQTNCKVKLYDYPLQDGTGEKSAKVGKRSMRDFRIEDLLLRDTLIIDNQKTKEFYQGKVVLVTGGGGSIGGELCQQIAALKPKKLVMLDIYENTTYEVQQELVRKYGDTLDLEVVIASVRDAKRMEEIFAEFRPQIVFHAAAHKHVPLMEYNGCEAIKNNVFGTYHVANMAEKYGVEKFLLISTDKAVNPTNIMGASKRLCEMVIQCRTDSKTDFTAVRFGNVLGSHGSVIPLFKRQIESGGPVTLTDKRIIRYFMTISEAVSLVMETCAMAHNGELFVLNMGKPVKILNLAENMIRLYGMEPYKDIDIVEIGLRNGEKLYEELLMKSEELDKTENEMIFIERDKPLGREEVENKLAVLQNLLNSTDAHNHFADCHDAVIAAIRETVPTYHDPDEINHIAEQSAEMSAAKEGRVPALANA